jgi:hypothetical protein
MSTPQVRGGLSITQLAARASVRPDTIRYYERTGLLPAPARTAGYHRRYDERALDRLQFIRGAKRLGLRLDAIAELLELRDAGQCPCDSAADTGRCCSRPRCSGCTPGGGGRLHAGGGRVVQPAAQASAASGGPAVQPGSL